MMNFKHHLATLFGRLTLAAALATTGGAASAGVIHVTVDTSTFGVGSGYIDMALGTENGVPLVTATVDHLVGFGNVTSVDSWGVTSIPGGFVFRNDTANDLFQGLAFGGVLSFDLNFIGAMDPNHFLTSFLLSAFADDGVGFKSLGHLDPVTGTLAEFTWLAAPDGQNGNIRINIADATVTAVPEPSDLLLVGAGLAVLALARRRRGDRSALPA